MLQPQPGRSRQETGQLIRAIPDDEDAPGLQRLEGRWKIQDRFHPGTNDEGAVRSTAYEWEGGMAFVHELAAPGEPRPHALAIEQFAWD